METKGVIALISIQIHEREIQTINKEKVLKGSKNYFTCNISFDHFWKDFEKTVVFKRIEPGSIPFCSYIKELTEEIIIPHEILEKSGEFKIGVFGVKNNITLPTLWSEEFTILTGSDTSGEIPNPTPTVYEEILIELKKIPELEKKQDALVSGENIKTINGKSLLGSGDITIEVSEEVPEYLRYIIEGNFAKITGCDTDIEGEVVIPSSIEGYPVERIASDAFAGCSELEEIVIPEGVQYMGSCTFYHCDKLRSITIPLSLEEVGEKQFSGGHIEIYYAGTQEDWNNIKGVEAFTYYNTATIHYGCSPATKGYVDEKIGDIETALDSIIAIQNELIGGGNL